MPARRPLLGIRACSLDLAAEPSPASRDRIGRDVEINLPHAGTNLCEASAASLAAHPGTGRGRPAGSLFHPCPCVFPSPIGDRDS
jgi:hypothetical protein